MPAEAFSHPGLLRWNTHIVLAALANTRAFVQGSVFQGALEFASDGFGVNVEFIRVQEASWSCSVQLNILEASADSMFYRVLLKLLGMDAATAVRGLLFSWPGCT